MDQMIPEQTVALRKSLFGAQSRSWTPLENEFLAENELIQIVPNFSCAKRQFVQGSFGPFRPAVPIRVPLWLAITLKKSKKCEIKLPQWMGENELKEILASEKENETFCNKLPFYYREISKIVFDMDSNKNHKNIRVLIQDIEDVRESKTKKGLKQLEPSTYIVHLNNISSNQLNKNIRVNVCNLLNCFYDITKVGPNSDSNSTQNTNSQFTQSSLNTSTYQANKENNASYANDQSQIGDSQKKGGAQPMRKL